MKTAKNAVTKKGKSLVLVSCEPSFEPSSARLKECLGLLGEAAGRKFFTTTVMDWGKENGRKGLPWQVKDPYAVWISEIMLQQTQVETVKPYFKKFMALWPDVKKLAAADEDEVLSAWAGLGYYRRAKFLHKAAKEVLARWGGEMPKKAGQLVSLPGIGKSTASAIASICHGERVAILDGNVVRVLTRFFGYSEDVSKSATQKRLWSTAEDLVPEKGSGKYTQFIMDMGATVCLPVNPQCGRCPLSSKCEAHRSASWSTLPFKNKAKKPRRQESVVWNVLYDGQSVVMVKNDSQEGVWQSMHLFASSKAAWGELPKENLGEWSFKHVFSHFDLWIDVRLAKVASEDLQAACDRNEGWICAKVEDALNLSVPAPVKSVLLKIIQIKRGGNAAIS